MFKCLLGKVFFNPSLKCFFLMILKCENTSVRSSLNETICEISLTALILALQGSSQRLDHLSESDSHSVLGEGLSQGGPSPISTPLLPGKRKTNDRKLRPKSVVDNGEGYGPGEPNIFLC